MSRSASSSGASRIASTKASWWFMAEALLDGIDLPAGEAGRSGGGRRRLFRAGRARGAPGTRLAPRPGAASLQPPRPSREPAPRRGPLAPATGGSSMSRTVRAFAPAVAALLLLACAPRTQAQTFVSWSNYCPPVVSYYAPTVSYYTA